MKTKTIKTDGNARLKPSVRVPRYDPELAKPIINQDGVELQPFGKIVRLPIGLSEEVCKESVERLNQILADTMTLRDLYKKHHWQVRGLAFYQRPPRQRSHPAPPQTNLVPRRTLRFDAPRIAASMPGTQPRRPR